MEKNLDISTEYYDTLAELVVQRYHDAVAHRQGTQFYMGKTLDDWLEEAIDRYMKRGCNNHFNLTRIKTAALHAKVKDMVVNSIDAPFVIQPTPIPALSKKQMDTVEDILLELLGNKLIEAELTIMDEEGNVWPDYSTVLDEDQITMVPSVKRWLKQRAIEQKTTMLTEARRIANEAAGHATTLMQDQMFEGGWREAYLDCLFDIFLYGTGVIRTEVRRVQSLKWDGDKLAPTTEDRITWRHVPITACYPSADSESAQEGTYFIERGAMRKQDLFAAAQIDWVDEDRVQEAFEAAEESYSWLSDSDHEQSTTWRDDDFIDVLIHEGVVRGSSLLEWFDEERAEGIEPDAFYEAEIWVVANVTIGVRLVEYPAGTRSYFSGNFQRAGRTFWGIGSAMTLASIEDRLNDLFTDLTDNLELSVAPPIFYNAAMFDNPEDITLDKRAKVPFNPELGTNINNPFYQPRFDSKSTELINIINWAYRLADDESGIPGLLSGNDSLHGGESTFRGMKMLSASANILIKGAFLNIDQTIIQPAMQHLWRWNMLNSKDDSIKADATVVARGAAGLMQRELADAERSDVLPILMQLVQSAGLDQQQVAGIMQYLLRETMEQGGMPVNELMPNAGVPGEQDRIVNTLQPATPEPTIGQDQNTGGLSNVA